MSRVVHIFIAPLKGAPTRAVSRVEAIAGRGLEGDRYAEARNRHGEAQNQVTLIELENIEGFNARTGLALRPDGPRRNIVTEGVRLNDLVGRRFFVGEALLEGFELCEPCGLFARRTFPQVRREFRSRGGLRAVVLATGLIRVDDAIRMEPEARSAAR